jgi:hypothetical protein
MDEINVNGEVYVRRAIATGKRAVVVVDRGWIFAGDVEDVDGRIKITRAVWVFRWEAIGFDGVLRDPSKASIKKMPTDVNLPADAEVFRCPVADNWGL